MLKVMTRNSTLAPGAVGDEPAEPDEPEEPHAIRRVMAATAFRMDGVGRMARVVREGCQPSLAFGELRLDSAPPWFRPAAPRPLRGHDVRWLLKGSVTTYVRRRPQRSTRVVERHIKGIFCTPAEVRCLLFRKVVRSAFLCLMCVVSPLF